MLGSIRLDIRVLDLIIGAGFVLDDDLLALRLRALRRERTRQKVGDPAGRRRHNDVDRPHRVGLCRCRVCAEAQAGHRKRRQDIEPVPIATRAARSACSLALVGEGWGGGFKRD